MGWQGPWPLDPAGGGGVVVRRLAQPEVAEGRAALERVHSHGIVRQLGLDAVPRAVPEVEREQHVWFERPEEEGQEALVERGTDEQANRAEAVAEEPHPC